MARPWLDMLCKVTVDESSIIYSSVELGYLFFSAAWAARDHGIKQAASHGLFMWLSAGSKVNPAVKGAMTGAVAWHRRCTRTGFTSTVALIGPAFMSHIRDQCELWIRPKMWLLTVYLHFAYHDGNVIAALMHFWFSDHINVLKAY